MLALTEFSVLSKLTSVSESQYGSIWKAKTEFYYRSENNHNAKKALKSRKK